MKVIVVALGQHMEDKQLHLRYRHQAKRFMDMPFMFSKETITLSVQFLAQSIIKWIIKGKNYVVHMKCL